MLELKEIKASVPQKTAIALKGNELANYLFQADYLKIDDKLISMKYLTRPEKVLKILQQYGVKILKVGTMGPSLKSFFRNYGIEVTSD